MDDFIFGTLSTEASRLTHIQTTRGGITHAQRRLPRDPQPGQPTQIFLTLGPSHPHPRAWVYWTNDGSDPAGQNGIASNGHAAPLTPVSSEWDSLLWGYVRTLRGEIPAQGRGVIVRYRIAASGDGEDALADNGAYYAYYVDDDPPPAWTKDAVIYQVFVDRFFSSAIDFPTVEEKPSLKCNGTLRGLIEKLDYIAALGVNCIWLTPVHPSPSYHGYDATDFYEINPRLGTKEDFKELIGQAHARGIRILMDYVPNHWSNLHPFFQEARTDKNSPYVQWHTFEQWPDEYKKFFTARSLPQINLRFPPARQHVTGAARYWLEFGVDGFRVDYCIGPTPDFYADFRAATRTAKPESWTFGEAVDPPDSQLTFEGGMDGALDFMLLEALRNAFAFGKWDARQFADFLDRHEAYFPDSFSRPSFLDNHDMNRFLWVAKGDLRKLKLAALCQFTLQGAPVIYYGTEVGLSQPRDMMQNGHAIHEEARMPMLWGADQNTDLLDFYRALIQLRKSESALRHGTRETIFANDNLLAYRRAWDGESLVCVMNLSANAAELGLEAAESRLMLATSPEASIQPDGRVKRIFLPAYGGVIFK